MLALEMFTGLCICCSCCFPTPMCNLYNKIKETCFYNSLYLRRHSNYYILSLHGNNNGTKMLSIAMALKFIMIKRFINIKIRTEGPGIDAIKFKVPT